MAEKQQGQYPLAPATALPRSDYESTTNYQLAEQAMKRKKRMRCLAFIAALAVIQAVIIVVITVVFLRVKTPKVRLEDVEVINRGNGSVSFSARVAVKNTNYGRYKLDGGVATVTAANGVLGRFVIPEARARARSTKRIYVVVDLTSPAANSNNNADLRVSVTANLRGKVELLRFIKRNKWATLSCMMSINLPARSVQGLTCQ